MTTWQTLKADWQVLKGAVRRGRVIRPHCDLTQPATDIEASYDVAVPLSDCTMLTANVFASRATGSGRAGSGSDVRSSL